VAFEVCIKAAPFQSKFTWTTAAASKAQGQTNPGGSRLAREMLKLCAVQRSALEVVRLPARLTRAIKCEGNV